MAVIKSNLQTGSEAFAENKAFMTGLVAQLRDRLNQVRQGGGPDAIAKHRSRGKMLARERIERMVDPATAFMEFSPLAAWDMYDDDAPAAGMITGIGVVSGQECLIIANDATVKAGAWFPITGKKNLRAQEIAMENRLPIIYESRQWAENGGLTSYGRSLSDLDRRAATYVDKILEGAKPGDLPVEQPTKFELVINLKTAKQIGLTVPQRMLARADRIIR